MTEPATQVYRALQRLARARGRGTQQVMELYIHERLLARVAESRYSDRLTLKGGMLLAALEVRDVTRDADLLARAIDNDAATVEAVVAGIAAVDLGDGPVFDVQAITTSVMREDNDYQGLRVRVPVSLAAARLVAQLDINFGDPVAGEPMLVGGSFVDGVEQATSFMLNAYRIEDVLAEKIATMIDRGDLNTRERDFSDVWLIGHQMSVDGDQLMQALRVTVVHRGHDLAPLAQRLQTISVDRQPAWDRYRAVLGHSALPSSYAEVLAFVVSFADPVIAGERLGPVERAKTSSMLDLLMLTGTSLRMPHVRDLGGGLCELRVRTGQQPRLYFTIHEDTARFLTYGRKDTQQRDIQRARGRM